MVLKNRITIIQPKNTLPNNERTLISFLLFYETNRCKKALFLYNLPVYNRLHVMSVGLKLDKATDIVA